MDDRLALPGRLGVGVKTTYTPLMAKHDAFYRLWYKVNRPEYGCWPWRGPSLGVSGGYHLVAIGTNPETGKPTNKIASRLVFEVMYGGPLPEGMEVGHLCGNPNCVKPTHLAGMTHLQNCAMKRPHALYRAEKMARTLAS